MEKVEIIKIGTWTKKVSHSNTWGKDYGFVFNNNEGELNYSVYDNYSRVIVKYNKKVILDITFSFLDCKNTAKVDKFKDFEDLKYALLNNNELKVFLIAYIQNMCFIKEERPSLVEGLLESLKE